jgi:hypothetical protein
MFWAVIGYALLAAAVAVGTVALIERKHVRTALELAGIAAILGATALAGYADRALVPWLAPVSVVGAVATAVAIRRDRRSDSGDG